MIPSKSTTNNSRRSSILKPPKSRHPLQNLNFSSSSENSPATTTKIKRRVSFAEKKHVKEFCNSLEQGTVWNNTYEENDLSNLKIPCSSNQKECEIESIFKKNIFDNHENDAQSDYNKVMEENINITENSSRVVNIVKNVNCQDEMLMTEPLITLHNAVVQENKSISLTNLQLENVNHISKSITPYEDCNKILNKKLNKKMSMLSDHNDLNIKSVKDTCVDLTKVVCNNICSNVNYIKDTVTEAVPENIPMELTQVILPSVNTQNMSMELTVPLLSVINDNINDVKMTTCENDRTKNFHNKSMCNLQSNSNYCVSCSDNDNKTTFFNDVPMDITKTVCKCEYNIAKQDEKTKLLNTSMEITSVVPANTRTKICTKDVTDPKNPENSIKLSECEYNIAKQDEKTKLLNTSMEITSVVPANTRTKICTKDVTDPNNPENGIKLSQCEYNIAKHDEKTKLLNTSMEITSIVSANTRTKICTKDVTDLNNPENSIKLSECEYNIAKQDERTKLLNTSMEITSVVPANTRTKIHREDTTHLNRTDNNIKKLRIDPFYETLANLSRTRLYSSESVEFDFTDVTTSPKIRASEHQNNLQTTMQNTPYTQSNSTLIFDSCNSHISSNKTITSHNNFTFTNILSLDVRNNSGKARVTDCETNINENKAIVTTQSQTEINSDTDSIKIRQSVLSDNFQNRDLADFTTCNVLKDITTTITIPCTLSSETVSDKEKLPDKENNFSKGIENDVLDKCSLIKVQSSVNVTSSMVLHESVQQDIFVSDLRKNNTVNSKLNKDKDKHAQTIISHPRRTYTIQSLDSNHTFIISNKENTNVSQINDNNFDINNQGNNVLNSEKCLQKNENYNEECPINKSDIIFNENTEILESIKTPTFYCLDDLSDTDQSINVNCNQEINCFSKNKNDKHENASNLNYYQSNVLDENVRKSCTFLIKCTSSNSKFDRVQADEIQKLKLLGMRNTNTKSQIIKCSSPIINDTEKLSQTFNVEENIQDLCLNNSNFENQNIQCLSNVRAICENTLKVNDDGKSVNINRMEINKESYTNEELEQSLKTHIIEKLICIEGNVAIKLNLFSSLMNELKDYTKSDEIIWEICHENIEKNMFIAGFISCSLLVVIFIRDICDVTNDEFIKEIKLISRLADDADILINIVHRIILEKLDVKKLLDLYKNREDILLMLDFISKEVKLAMDFMFELKCLNDLNLMEITRDRISFISQTRTGNIILEITVDIKPFDKIESRNISIHCLMGSVREEDVKKLIMNIKRDHKFLRKYINDVKDYIHLVEESVT